MSEESPGGKIYKYASPGLIAKILRGREGVTFKCARPYEFNDPYELFLTINRDLQPDLLAFYSDVVGELPQLPTTCFSRSPAVVPMWAHYAQNNEGFAIEVDESQLRSRYPQSSIGDVEYRSGPDPALNSSLERAYVTGKPRHTYILQNAVFGAAYFTKADCWSYEQERRLVVKDKDVRSEGGLFLLDIPGTAVSRIICGHRAGDTTRVELQDQADLLGCPFLELKIGRTSTMPYFLDVDEAAWLFDGKEFVEVQHRCSECGEPMLAPADFCALCSIQEAHRDNAARRNPYRMLDELGMLEGYIKDMDGISRRYRTPDSES